MNVFMKRAASSPTVPVVPTLASASPTIVALVDRRDALNAEAAALRAESLDLRRSGANEPPEDPQVARVAALLGKPHRPIAGSADRVVAISRRVSDITSAANILNSEIESEKRKASAVVCSQIKPEYRARVKDVCDAMIALCEANAALVDLTDALEEGDVQWSAIRVNYPNFVGSPRDPYSGPAIFLRECVAAGVVEASAVPAGLRL